MTPFYWQCGPRRFEITTKPLIMGIVNVTPDSFSDGGKHTGVEHGLKLASEGADILDIGGESTRPGAEPIPLHEELRRVIPVIEALAKQTDIPLSVDTSKAEVAQRAIDAGATIINDVTGLRGDPNMVQVAAKTAAGIVVMHMRGTPKTMQLNPHFDDVVKEINDFFAERIRTLTAWEIKPEAIAIDPGIGFGHKLEHTLTLLAHLAEFRHFGRPLCLGISRKGFLGQVTGRPVTERMAGTLAVSCFATAMGGVQIHRVHDVAPLRDAMLLHEAIRNT